MPGVAATFDTTTGLVHLSYNTATATLALQLRRVDPGSEDSLQTWEASSTDQPGFIVNPSQLAAATFLGTDVVLGITSQAAQAGKTPTQKDISIIGPVYKPLATTEPTNKAVAACSSGQAAWVYYLQGTDLDHLNINEAVVADGTPTTYEGYTSILPGSYLGAYYSSAEDARHVIYQANDDSLLHDYKCADGGDAPISNTTDAADCTAIACTFVNGSAYLYYVTRKGVLRRIAKDNRTGWGDSTNVANAHLVAQDSHLAVIYSGDMNHIFYVASGDTEDRFVHVKDIL